MLWFRNFCYRIFKKQWKWQQGESRNRQFLWFFCDPLKVVFPILLCHFFNWMNQCQLQIISAKIQMHPSCGLIFRSNYVFWMPHSLLYVSLVFICGSRQLAHIFGQIFHLVQNYPHHLKNMAVKLILKSRNLKIIAMVTCVRDWRSGSPPLRAF